MTYREAALRAAERLRAAGVDDAELDARLLLLHASGLDHAHYLAEEYEAVPEDVLREYRGLTDRRAARVPLQQITGQQEFMGISFEVSEDVLIPRQDTECLAGEAVRVLEEKHRSRERLRVLDLCTGSGCIAVSIAKFCPYAKVFGSDLSPQALDIARRNAQNASVRVTFLEGDLFGLPEEAQGRFDLITCNPPYIRSADIDTLMDEVRLHEPLTALDGGADGLHFYRRLAQEYAGRLEEGGVLLTEIGYDQGPAVRALFEQAGASQIHVLKDLAGHDRVVEIYV